MLIIFSPCRYRSSSKFSSETYIAKIHVKSISNTENILLFRGLWFASCYICIESFLQSLVSINYLDLYVSFATFRWKETNGRAASGGDRSRAPPEVQSRAPPKVQSWVRSVGPNSSSLTPHFVCFRAWRFETPEIAVVHWVIMVAPKTLQNPGKTLVFQKSADLRTIPIDIAEFDWMTFHVQ